MTRLEALEQLASHVEAGTLHEQKHGGMPFATACYPRRDDDTYDDSKWSDRDCMSAYHGSLDGAKSIHECALGDGYIGDGWKYAIWGMGRVSVFEVVKGMSFSAEFPEKELHTVAPARAWLLAILKALIALEKSHD